MKTWDRWNKGGLQTPHFYMFYKHHMFTAPHTNPQLQGANVLTHVELWPVNMKLNPSWKMEVSKSAWINIYIYIYIYIKLLLLTKRFILLDVSLCLLGMGWFYGILLFELLAWNFHFGITWKIIVPARQDPLCIEIGSLLSRMISCKSFLQPADSLENMKWKKL